LSEDSRPSWDCAGVNSDRSAPQGRRCRIRSDAARADDGSQRTDEAGGAGEDPTIEDPRALALRDRGETAIKSFLVLVIGAPTLLAFAEFLRSVEHAWPNHFGALADPMEKVLSLIDPKPVFGLQALTLLLRSGAFLTNTWKRNDLLFDALDALYAVTFSLLGFLVGAGVYLAIFRLEIALLIEAVALVVLSSLVLLGIDFAELKMTPFLQNAFYRVTLAVLYFLFAATALLTNK
jgi:hypothetical protein